MTRTSSITTLLLIALAIYWSFRALMPTYKPDDTATKTSFSTDRALKHVKNMSQKPHAVGFKGHSEVREFIITELEKLGLETTIQEGYTAGDWGNLSKVVNILARIKGSEPGKALLLLSHYDSSTHSSFGASDAASGVATILEGIRAFLASDSRPKNDIIILISDAEELGLNGADLFVNNHPWKKDVGLVLNFEARGSGGPSYMLIETNRGNETLIKEFTKANPKYPVANSLTYSIYKRLPNDTDLTVFREDGDIEGFNFAFIDDHFDYHTANDIYERLDKKTMAHQGSYLMPLLQHFSQADLTNLKSLNDSIYFNIPFFKLVSYPNEWVWPMYGLAVLFFIVLLFYGFKRKTLHIQQITQAFIPMLIAILVNGIMGYYSWSFLKWMYPEYQDILHKFTYNGHTYIFAFVFFTLGVCFWVYKKFSKIRPVNLIVAPLILWLLICGLINHYLIGASFFIIPVFALLASFMVLINQKWPNVFLMTFLALPALFIFAPFVKMFPVGLGLEKLYATTLFTTLIFFLLLPVVGYYRKKRRVAVFSLLLFFGCMILAHTNSGFNKENPKPSSLLYILNSDTNTAKWATYENQLSKWTQQYLNTDKKRAELSSNKTISSKYSSGFTYVAKAPLKEIPAMQLLTSTDTIIENSRFINLAITPNRPINRLEIFTATELEAATVNDIALSTHFLEHRRHGKLITHYVSDNDSTVLQLQFSKDATLELTIYEASNDLLTNKNFSIPNRPDDNIPMPFILNDAILVTKTVRFE